MLDSLTRISEKFAQLRNAGQMAFMPFITAGDPDMDLTLALIRELAKRGVDLIEVGFPYSDPIADGPVIQASYQRALDRKLQVRDIFAAIRSLHAEKEPIPPLVGMVSFAIIFRLGAEKFVRLAAEAGFSGLIVPDLPGDEAEDLARIVKSHGLDLVELIAPTTTPTRVARIVKNASGFLYCISVAGTTGVRDTLPAELREQLGWLRTQTDLPLAVGFGISRPEQVDELRGLAEGVIVGSALVKQMQLLADGKATREELLRACGDFAAQMVAATKRTRL